MDPLCVNALIARSFLRSTWPNDCARRTLFRLTRLSSTVYHLCYVLCSRIQLLTPNGLGARDQF